MSVFKILKRLRFCISKIKQEDSKLIYTNSDGGARGNPGPGAIGVVVRDDEKILIEHASMVGSFVTNNVCEYEGLIKALALAATVTDKEVTCIMDSELVVKQLLGEYKVKHPKMRELFLKVQALLDKFEKVKFQHARREDINQSKADALLNKELAKHGFPKKIYKKH